MGVTPIYGFPYPALTDSPNGPAQFQALAEAVEDDLNTVAGTVSSLSTTVGTRPRGVIGLVQGTGNVAIAAAETLIDSITWTHTQNRYEQFRFSSRFSLDVTGVVTMRFRFVAGAGPVNNGHTIAYETIVKGDGSNNHMTIMKVLNSTFRALTTATYTIGVFALPGAGAASGVFNGGAGGIERDFVGVDLGAV